MLNELKEQTEISNHENADYLCPICENNCEELSNDDAKIVESTE